MNIILISVTQYRKRHLPATRYAPYTRSPLIYSLPTNPSRTGPFSLVVPLLLVCGEFWCEFDATKMLGCTRNHLEPNHNALA